jgi:signal transduction histidine kinase
MGMMTELADPRWTGLAPPAEFTGGLFGRGRSIVRTHPLASDALLAAVLLVLSTIWLARSGFASPATAALQAGLVATVAVRRVAPLWVFLLGAALAFTQWLFFAPLAGDGALLIGLYTVAAHETWLRAVLAAALLEAGAVMASVQWEPAGSVQRSLLFLTGTMVAALFAGLAAASGSRYLAWMDERARRLTLERDQQAAIAAAAERTRIARELHDIVSHSLSVVITLADAAAVVSRSDPGREAMADVSEAGRQALSDLRAMLGVLRTDEGQADLAPQPGLSQLAELVERVRATGLAVDFEVTGTPFPLGGAAGLTVYRIVQEALTNTIRHARARQARVTISYEAPRLRLEVADDGAGLTPDESERGRGSRGGHGIDGMRERAALHDGSVTAGAAPGGGWLVSAVLRPGPGTGAR